MKLADLVRLRMKELDVSAAEIERRSGKAVTDTHIATILAGEAQNPTLKVLMGLSKALEIHPMEVFKAASEVDEPSDSWKPEELVEAFQRMLFLSPDEIKRVKKILKLK
jgi:transcriptional regulator with XRE-family HTH domain